PTGYGLNDLDADFRHRASGRKVVEHPARDVRRERQGVDLCAGRDVDRRDACGRSERGDGAVEAVALRSSITRQALDALVSLRTLDALRTSRSNRAHQLWR